MFDFAVIGAGIAGASVAYRLALQASTIVLETESQPGYHSTGRSAAMFMETYGTAAVRALTRASRAFYESPPSGFAGHSLLSTRGAMYVATPEQEALLDRVSADWTASAKGCFRRIKREEAIARVPVLRPECLHGALIEDDALDIDVHGLHQGFLAGARRAGVELRTEAKVVEARRAGDHWRIMLSDGQLVKARVFVNAAGAWADVVAQSCQVRPIGIEPRRRSAFTFDAPAGESIEGWPAVLGIDESYYFKPDAGQLLGSPANADPVQPHDVVPEEIDVATGIHMIEASTTLTIRRPRHSWAGLRSFVADGDMVIGWDDAEPGFFWLAAQGGYGIQTAAAASELAAALLLRTPMPEQLAAQGIAFEQMSVRRLR